ncbi:MAG TPA: ATP-binding cassette domain-containing protein [Streptosporangiaceae bacterium]
MPEPALRVTGLTKRFGRVLACQDVGFEVARGEALGLIGESGSGKTTVLRCLAGDVTPDAGTALLRQGADELDLFALLGAERRALRVSTVSIVYQDPAQGLNLRISAGGNIAERLIAAGGRNFGQLRARAAGLLRRVDVPLDRMDDPVGTFSGGMMQRVQLAKAVANDPDLLLLDEPTTGLDASIAAGVLDLIRDLIEESGVTALVVSHDMTVISMLASRAVVLRDGLMVEAGLTDQLLDDPQHAYSQRLVAAARGGLG